MFGDDFVQLCLEPEHPLFQNYSISRDIVRQCAQQAEQWKRLAASYKVHPSLSLSKRSSDSTTDVMLRPLDLALSSVAQSVQRLRKRRRLCRGIEHAGKDAENVAAVNIPAPFDGCGDQRAAFSDVDEGQDPQPLTQLLQDSETSMHDAALILSYMADAEKVAVAKIMLDFRAGGASMA